jgi:membrane dipeptidase
MSDNSSTEREIIWDAHCCVPLLISTQLEKILRCHHQAGFRFVSINIGMDMIPLSRILSLVDRFHAEIQASDFLILAKSIFDVQHACQNNLLAVAFDLEGGFLFFESEHMVNLFSQLGVRQALLAYNRNNSLAGGCYDVDMPLSTAGKHIISAMIRHGMIIDCSHVGFQSSLDIMSFANVPVVFSHSNPFALVKNKRNLQDIQIKACAQTGGVICISGLSWLLGEEKPTADAMIRHIDYIANLVGIEHVGIGLDYIYNDQIDDLPDDIDMNYWWPSHSFQKRQFPCSFLPPESISSLTHKLSQYYSKTEVQMILGKNMMNLASKIWK